MPPEAKRKGTSSEERVPRSCDPERDPAVACGAGGTDRDDNAERGPGGSHSVSTAPRKACSPRSRGSRTGIAPHTCRASEAPSEPRCPRRSEGRSGRSATKLIPRPASPPGRPLCRLQEPSWRRTLTSLPSCCRMTSVPVQQRRGSRWPPRCPTPRLCLNPDSTLTRPGGEQQHPPPRQELDGSHPGRSWRPPAQ